MKKQFYLLVFLGTFLGCSKSSDTTPVTPVVPKPTADFTWTESSNGNVQFTNNSKNATSYQWDFGDNIGKSTSQSPKYTFEFKGNYQVTLTAKGDGGETQATNTVNITTGKDPVPVPNFTWSETSGVVTFSNTSKYSTSYSWDFGDGTNSTEINPKHTYSSNKNYDVVLVAKGTGGQTNLKQQIQVSKVPDPRDKFVGNWKRAFFLQGDPTQYFDTFAISKDNFTAEKVLIVFSSSGAYAKWEATVKGNTISYVDQAITEGFSVSNNSFFANFTCSGDISSDGKTVNLTGIDKGIGGTVKVIEVWTKQ